MPASNFDTYIALRDEIDAASTKFEKMHQSQLKCQKGCDSCCESISVFPLEFYAIRDALKLRNDLPRRKFRHKITKACRFLIAGACSIYESRPIICRTQGLPLLYENSEGRGYELSVCKLNFVGVDVSKFNMENALFMPPFNSRLFLLNKDFNQLFGDKKTKDTTRIPLNDL